LVTKLSRTLDFCHIFSAFRNFLEISDFVSKKAVF